MTLRALLFDFDGLLLDTEGAELRSWIELYDRHGHEFPLDRYYANVGTLSGGFDPLHHLAELGIFADEDERRERDLALCDLEELRPGVVELLDEAERRGLATAIVSSSSDSWIDRNLRHRDLLDRFTAVVCANGDAARAKPAPTLYLEAVERLGVRPEEAVAFEDSPNGVAAAVAAGVLCVAVPNAVTGPLDFSRADLVVASLEDVDLDALQEQGAAR
jgi:HAD superfamily hydrolase (TIGR01509 family)